MSQYLRHPHVILPTAPPREAINPPHLPIRRLAHVTVSSTLAFLRFEGAGEPSLAVGDLVVDGCEAAAAIALGQLGG